MKENALRFLRAAFPFIAALFLWRLAMPFWNPGGILAIIVVFYCTFIKPVPGFGFFSALICFLIDYNFGTLCYWTALYCLAYAAYGFQSVIDLTRMDRNGVDAFAAFFGIAVFILGVLHFNLANVLKIIWVFIWTVGLYGPFTTLIKRVDHD